MKYIAKLHHVTNNTYRIILYNETGSITDIIEFTGRSISNGFQPLKHHRVDELKIDWCVDFGRASNLQTKIIKAILQHG